MASYSQRSLNQIIAEFQQIATQHRFINSFACGTSDTFATSGDTQYPAMWVKNEGVTIDKTIQSISFSILVIDRVKKDRTNLQEVLSDTIRTLSDFRIQIEQPAYGWEVEFSESVPVYEEYMEDEVAGWETTFTIIQPFVNDVCAIPFIVPPTPVNGWNAGGGTTEWPNYVQTSRQLTINGTTYDLSADRSWTVSADAGTWGSITGTLSDQTDLQTALDNKIFVVKMITNSSLTPADGTTYYFGCVLTGLITTAASKQFKIPYDCTLIGASISATNNITNATSESSTISIRKNNTTDLLLSSSVSFGGVVPITNQTVVTGLNTAYVADDLIEAKWLTATWVTNPAAASLSIDLYFRA